MKQRMMEIWILVTDDKKKAGVLGGLFAVLFFFGIRTFMGGSPDVVSASENVSGHVHDDSFVGSSVRALEAMDGKKGSQIITLVAPARLSRDLFEITEEHFPQTAQTEHTGADGGKSGSGTTETVVGRPLEAVPSPEERIAEEASAFELRSTIVGENPVAILVSGRDQYVLTRGDEFAGFTVVEIRLRSVVLEKDGVQVEIAR